MPRTGPSEKSDQRPTRPLLEFVNAAPVNGIQARNIRRQVRSHAAKVGGSGDVDLSTTRTSSNKTTNATASRRRTRQQNFSWSVEVNVEQQGDQASDQLTTSSLTSPTSSSISGGATIPASKSPVYYETFVPLVIENYLQYLAVAIPEVDGVGNFGLLKSRWFPLVMHSPVVFQVIVLFSASHYAAQLEGMAFAPTILSLKQSALQGIYRELAHSTGAARDELIAATAKMASYEAIWGDESAYHCHMHGVQEMLKTRGGLGNLGLDGFLSRLLVFIDTNSAFLLKSALHLQESAFPRREPFMLPNLSRFMGEM